MSSISLADLESAAAAIAEIGRDEITFNVMDTAVTLRTLYADEEIECQRFAVETFEEGDPNNSATTLDYFDRFRLVALSTAIVQLGDLDLRGVEFIETGEVLGNNKPVIVPKNQALRKILRSWGRTIQIGMFDKHFELTDRMEAAAEKAIVFDPADTDAEIDRLKARIKELEDQNIRRVDQNRNLFKGINKAVHDHGHAGQDVKKAVLNEEVETESTGQQPSQPPPPATSPPKAPSASIVPPTVAPPPSRDPVQAQPPVQAPVPAQASAQAQAPQVQYQAPVQQQVPGVVVTPPANDPLEHVRSSFMDPEDAGGMEAAMIEETKRFYEARQRSQAGVPSNDGSVLTQMRQGPQGGPVAPHVAAYQLNQGLKNDEEFQRQEAMWHAAQADALQTESLQTQALRAQALQANDASNLKQALLDQEQLDGKGVHRLPIEPLERRRAPSPKQVATDPKLAGVRNPRFQQPK